MNDREQAYYADFIMGMRERSKEELDWQSAGDNKAAEEYYGEDVYGAIKSDFALRIHRNLEKSENRSVQRRLP